jgi:hypothetical protein
MLEYPYIFAMSGYSDMADLEEDPNNLGEDGSERLEAGIPQDQGSTGQAMEPTTERRSLLGRPSLEISQPEHRRNQFSRKLPEGRV